MGSWSGFDLSKKVGCKHFKVMPTFMHAFTARNCATITIFRKIGLRVLCKQCEQWCHKACEPIIERGKKAFIYDFCYH